MQRKIVKFSGNRLTGYTREEETNEIPYKCSNGEGIYVLCGRCGKYMEFDTRKLVFRCSCGSEVDETRVENYAFRKFREEMKGTEKAR